MDNTSKYIWYVSKYANISRYGADTRQAYFCKEFADKGYRVKLITSNSSHLYSTLPKFRGAFREEVYNGFTLVWINTLKYKKNNYFLRVISWFHFEVMMIVYILKSRIKPDVFIASSLSLLTVFSGLFCKCLYNSKFIFEVRDIWPQSLVELYGASNYNLSVFFLSMVEKLGYKYSDVIVGTMELLYEHVKCRGVKADKTVYIPHGVSTDFYLHEQEEIEREYIDKYFSKTKPNFLYAGTLSKAYQLERFVKFARIYTHFNFILVGDGSEKESLLSLSSGIENFTIAPKVNRNKVGSLLSHADLLLHSFSGHEVFKYGVSPNKFVDYIQAGKPIICIGDVHCSLLYRTGYGTVVDPNNYALFHRVSMSYLLMSPIEKQTFANRARSYLYNELSYKRLSEDYCALFDYKTNH